MGVVYFITGSTHSKIPDDSKIHVYTKIHRTSIIPDNSKLSGDSRMPYNAKTQNISKKPYDHSKFPDNSTIRYNDVKMHANSKKPRNSKTFANSEIHDISKLSSNSKLPDNWKMLANRKVRNNSEIFSYSKMQYSENNKRHSSRPKRILFYNPRIYQLSRNLKGNSASLFRNCEIKNCEIVYRRSLLNDSDAVLLSSVFGLNIKKKPGQVWILLQWESTQMHTHLAPQSAPVYMKNKINWTVSYSTNADIYLPYGRLRQLPKEARPHRNYIQIANSKTKDAVWIVSHCQTFSKREHYVKILKKYISVDILGACGEKWNCGRKLIHDRCFDIYNTTFRYNLAFENSLCQEYITEKFYENYKYDILQVVRGNTPSKKPINISHEAYISANDFKNAHQLGKFLRSLRSNPQKYASMLRKKDEYTVVPYMELFRDAGCEICKRLHSVDKYRSVYSDPFQWMREKEPCYEPKDIYGA